MTIEAKLTRLLDAYLDQTITHAEYAKVKNKLVNRKIEIRESLTTVGRKGNNRLEPFRKWILDAHQAQFVAQSDNLEEKRSFLQKIGSDFYLTEQKAVISLAKPWLFVSQKPANSDWSG